MIHVLSNYSQLRDRHQEVTVIHGRSQCQGTVKTRPTIGTHHPQQVVAAKLVQPFSSEGNPKGNSGWPVKHARAQTQCETDRPCLAPSSHHIYRSCAATAVPRSEKWSDAAGCKCLPSCSPTATFWASRLFDTASNN